MDKKDIKILEDLGYVADSMNFRNKLINCLDSQEKDLETIQKELLEVKKSAKKKGLFIRSELNKATFTVGEAIIISQNLQKQAINKKLKKFSHKNKEKKNKI